MFYLSFIPEEDQMDEIEIEINGHLFFREDALPCSRLASRALIQAARWMRDNPDSPVSARENILAVLDIIEEQTKEN